MVTDIRLGDRIRFKKKHPCGGEEWQVVRLGADIGLKCLRCGRRILLQRGSLERRIREIIPAPPPSELPE